MVAVRRAQTALEAVDLVKTYSAGRNNPPVRALRGLSFSAAKGTVFGLLGPNGAGKSTTVKILSTLSVADSGSAHVAGVDVTAKPHRVRRAIGFVAQKPGTDPMATATENLLLAGRLHGMSRHDATARARELIDRFGLAEAANRLVSTYSGGMARKLDVALGLMHRPQVLFLDEPTTGLDPQARSEMWHEIARMAADEQMTVLLTTHYLDEADHLADRLAIVDHGTVVATGTPEELKSELRGDAVQIELAEADDRAAAVLRRVHGLREITMDGCTVRGRTDDGARALPPALAALDEAGIAVASATLARPSLDDVYLRHTGHALQAPGGEDLKALEAAK
ncbi:ATP-binding cassette domain-containing protein [Streptomyces sp. NEAU-Y11]|uniref:ATP-binding cassette domain-containing protein n=1 Tax=Streptomyces cucumeris TaxID=2962890 RepID=UPI0020C92DAE|nr:ATP-binding cassette domain-containing protein [Streptomyces sp. NEAU-Y11]MCP9206779.1 ATP-binding cassette domain-containing protein [Streptomyces sp. NEAU-Y11]MCP9211685.1 ATP-binding cassette domain-containing protein [Streptomyces sp. NEAU-Y11]